jgi:glycosyltransferase involved in cell wall biosynthesis
MARILVGLHHLELGGSQLNALDLAIAMCERGHHVAAFGTHEAAEPGPVAAMARAAGLGLTLVRARQTPRRGALRRPAVTRALTHLVTEQQIDLVHSYEFPLSLDSFYGPHLRYGVPLVYTTYAMVVPRWLPRYPGMVVGTRLLADGSAAFRNPPVLIEPPVNTDKDDPALVDGFAFRAEYGIAADEIVLVVVSRLEPDMKAEGIERAMAAIRLLSTQRGRRLRLVIVGDGPSHSYLSQRAAEVNAALGRQAVMMTGSLRDPRRAYAAAHIALGMGGSALRAMSFGKPLIVLGTQGFARTFTPETAASFFSGGFYGIGSGDLDPRPLGKQIAELAADARRREELGTYSRHIIVERFSLKEAAARLDEVYGAALRSRSGVARRVREAARTALYRTAADTVPSPVKDLIRPLAPRNLRRGPQMQVVDPDRG